MPLSLLAHTDRPRSSKDVRTWHSGGLSVTRFVSISHPTSKLRPRSILDDSTLVLALSPGEPTGDFRATPQRGFHEVDVGVYLIYCDIRLCGLYVFRKIGSCLPVLDTWFSLI